MLDTLQARGVAGLGGALFPTHLKLARRGLDTLVVNGESFALQLIPSGVLYDHITPVIGNGVVVDPTHLLAEIERLAADPAAEQRELAAIYVQRGLDKALARQVAEQLTAHDALGTHLRDELGIRPSAETLQLMQKDYVYPQVAKP